MIFLRQSTASQEIPLGRFVDSTNGDTEETGLTIANTDIKLWKTGATTLASKNSGGATHIANGEYYCVLDATDTDTIGPMKVAVHVAGALSVQVWCTVLDEAVYDVMFGTTAIATATNITAGTITTATNVTTVNGLAAGVITAASIAADAITDAKVASDVTIASVTGAVGSVTGNVGGNVTGSVGSIATGGIVAASFAAGAIDAAAIAADAIGSSELAASAITEIQAGLSTLDAAGIRTAVGLASANLDTQLSTIDDFLDTEVAAIKAKTDNLPSDPADASDVAAAFSTVNSTLATIAGYIDTEISTLLTRLGTPSDLGSGASIAANLVDIEGQTDDIGAAGAGLTAVFAANTVEGTYDAKETLKLLLAYIAGKTTITGVSGDNATVTFRDTGDTVDRIVAAMIGSERDSVTLNVT